jgi:hypothetical protein
VCGMFVEVRVVWGGGGAGGAGVGCMIHIMHDSMLGYKVTCYCIAVNIFYTIVFLHFPHLSAVATTFSNYIGIRYVITRARNTVKTRNSKFSDNLLILGKPAMVSG